jgi:hypothetical protein
LRKGVGPCIQRIERFTMGARMRKQTAIGLFILVSSVDKSDLPWPDSRNPS